MGLAGTAAAQTTHPVPYTNPEFSPSPLPKFLISPTETLVQPPRNELITVPEDPKARKPKRRTLFKRKKKLETKEVEKVEDLNATQVVLGDTHEYVSDSMVGLANRLDAFLGSKRADDELNRSSLRLSYAYRLRENTPPRGQSEVRFNLRLSSVDKFLKRFRMDNNEKAKLGPDGKKKKKKREPWRFRTDVGVVVSIPIPQAFTRARVRKNWIYKKYITRFEDELGWYTDRSWLHTTQFNIDREIQKNEQLFRFVNEADWRITYKRFVTTHGPSILHNTSEDDVWSYNFRVGTVKDGASYFMSGYGISVAYRRNLQGQWLYGEIVPALDWPYDQGWRRTPGITLKIETLFGRR